jgi:cysteine desulfurase
MSRTGVPPEGYLDASAGEPLHPAAREALLLAAEQGWADPAALTPPARRARILHDGAVTSLAGSLGRPAAEVHAIHGDPLPAALDQLLTQPFSPDPVVITSAVDREYVLHRLADLRDAGIATEIVEVDALGRIRLDQLADLLDRHRDRALLSFQAANAEVGTIQPVAEISALARASGAPLHLDYLAAIGRVPLVEATYISAPANSWAGPRGVGVVLAAPGAATSRLATAGAVISLPLLIAAAAALEARMNEGPAEDRRLHALVAELRDIVGAIPDSDVAGDAEARLPHVLTTSFLYVDGQLLMDALARHGLYIGSGSACVTSRIEPSHVLAAMGRLSHGNIRVALPHGTRSSDVERLGALLPGMVSSLRSEMGIGT